LPFLAFSAITTPRLFSTWLTKPDFALFALVFLNNLFYFAAFILLIVLLAQRSTAGANRFGPEVLDPK
jgi:uncharacterized membrane protein YhaH (DUF805 family)